MSLLVENSPKAVTRGEFVNRIWKGTYCSDSTINQTIKSIRKKIGDKEHEIIKTVPRVGYIIEEKHRFDMHSSPPFAFPGMGAGTAVDERQQRMPVGCGDNGAADPTAGTQSRR